MTSNVFLPSPIKTLILRYREAKIIRGKHTDLKNLRKLSKSEGSQELQNLNSKQEQSNQNILVSKDSKFDDFHALSCALYKVLLCL